MFSYSKFEHNYTKSAFKYVEPISEDYRVWINGEEIPVYTCRISKIPFNRRWPGHQREINQTELVSFVNIVSDEEINIEVVVNKEYQKIMIRPYSKGIEFCDDNGRVSFKLTQNGQFVFSCDDLHGCLYIFNSKPIEAPDPDSVTHYFGAGIYMPGKIVLKDNESIYVDKDALVFGCIYAEDASNVRVFGNGLFDDSNEERFYERCYEDYTNGNIKFYDCRNVSVEGVLFRNSAIWCVNLFHCFDVVLDDIKVFGQWRYNTDGVDIVNSQNITLKNSFIHSFDDTVTIKGIDRYITTNNENILTDGCVLWCDWGKTCETGLETACREYKNIIFRNCDIIRAGNTAMDIQNGDCAEVHHILFENINVEYNSFDNVPVLQENDEHIYNKYDEIFVPWLFRVDNHRFRTGSYAGYIPEKHADVDLNGIKQACNHDITVRNINVFYDEKIPLVDGKYNVPMFAVSSVEGVEYYNINISGIKINGKVIKEDEAIIEQKEVKNFTFSQEYDEFSQMKKNTVDSGNQLKDSRYVRFVNPNGKGKRVMFAGNSITLHGIKEDIGWYGEWGMAASCKENDYVHLLMDIINENEEDAVFCIAQVAEWERVYNNASSVYSLYETAREFDADIIVCRFIENCPGKDFDAKGFEKGYKEFLDYLNLSGNAQFILTTGFYKHPGDEIVQKIGKEMNLPVVYMGDLGEMDEMKAIGLFEHDGVANHPGDKGMKTIADRIAKVIFG